MDGNKLRVFAEAEQLFVAMLADIAAAKKRVWMETYIFADDASGSLISAALVKCAASGIETRLLYDSVGSVLTEASFFKEMADEGVDVHAYHTWFEALKHLSALAIMNRRDHRKLLVIDDRVAYFGGMNIVDHGRDFRYLDVPEEAAPELGWRDFHVRLEGPAQQDVAASFERSWQHAHGQPISIRPRAYRRARLSEGKGSIHFFDSGHGLGFSRGDRVFRHILRGTQHSAVIAMAYFIPVRRILGAILRLRRHGRRVTVIVPVLGDMPLAKYATQYLFTKFLRRGVRIFERTNRMLHAKLVVVDKQWTICGSSNMDPRSLWLNLEFLAVIKSRDFAKIARCICAYEIKHSRRVVMDPHRPMGKRFLSALAWALRWWL